MPDPEHPSYPSPIDQSPFLNNDFIKSHAHHLCYSIHRQSHPTLNVLSAYCKQDTTAQMTAYSDWFHLLDSGGFYQPLKCEHCGKTTDVRYWKSQRIGKVSNFGLPDEDEDDTGESINVWMQQIYIFQKVGMKIIDLATLMRN
jgi:hypothetical protein